MSPYRWLYPDLITTYVDVDNDGDGRRHRGHRCLREVMADALPDALRYRLVWKQSEQ